MSGMLGQILGGLLSGGQQGQQQPQQSPLAGILQQVLASGGKGGAGGGLSGILSQFQEAGLGQQAQSWVSSGANQPISSDQVSQVFSQQQINQWAGQAGTTPDAMRQVLAEALPHTIDHLTPAGQPPAPTTDIASMLNGLLGQLGGPRRV